MLAASCAGWAAVPPETVDALEGAITDSVQSQPAPSPWRGMVVGSITDRRGSDRFNPSNVAGMPRSVREVAAVLDYEAEGLSARFRARALARDLPYAKDDTLAREADLSMTQVNWTRRLANQWSASLGLINLGFDEGLSFHPLDFFEDTLRGSDFEDRAGRSRGFPMLMLQRTTPQGGVRLIYSDDRAFSDRAVYGDPNPNFNRGLRQALVSWRQSYEAWTWTTLIQRPWPGHAGTGASFSWVPGLAWSLYGAAFAAPGNPLPLHRNVAEGRGSALGAQDVYTSVSPIGPWQADDGRWRVRSLIGGQYVWEDRDSLQIEIWRDERGMNRDQLATWKQVRRFHDTWGDPFGRQANLGYDLAALKTPAGAHLFARYAFAGPQGESLQASVLVAQDRSGTWSLRWQGPNWAFGDLSVEVWQRFGGSESLYRAVPDSRGIALSWRSLF